MQPGYDRNVIERFLCAYHKVDHPWQFQPFGNRIFAFEVMRPVTLTVESQVANARFFPHQPSEPQTIRFPVVNDAAQGTRFLDNPAPLANQRFLHPETKQPMPLDFDHVCPYTIVTRHLRSNVQWPVAARLNFYHQGKETLEHRAEHDAMMEAGGAVRAGYVTIHPTGAAGQDVEVSAMPFEPFAFRNDFFTGTMALVNDSNLEKGIITIPRDVCIQAGLPVFQGHILTNSIMDMSISETEQKLMEIAKKRELKTISDWRAIPINHVLAWGMQSDEFARERGLRVLKFLFSPPPLAAAAPGNEKEHKKPDDVLLYYLIDDTAYYQLLEYFRRDWMGKVDVRPLSSMAFELLPLQAYGHQHHIAPEQVNGSIVVRSSIAYMVAPKLTAAQIAELAPALYPGFPTCHQWNPFKAPYLVEDGNDTDEEEKK